MFKLLVLACLLAVSMAAPENVVASKSEHETTVQNTNDPANPFDDTVVQKKSVHETVKSTDGSAATVAVDKTTISNPLGPYGANPLLLNPYAYSPYYNPYVYNPYGYNAFAYNPFFGNPRAFNPHVPSAYPPSYPAVPSYYKGY